jgi:LemA protein
VQLKRRADLLLISSKRSERCVSESGVFEAVTGARAESTGASTPADAGGRRRTTCRAPEEHLRRGGLPQLQASQNYLQLQGELVDTEDKIQASAPLLQRWRA